MNGKTPKLALGAWSWGTGNAGGDAVFGNHFSEEDLKPVFDKALECGLNLWDTAPVYGDGSSEKILGSFIRDIDRRDIIISTKFTPHIAGNSPNAAREMLEGSLKRLNTDHIDVYWIHNPNDVERWTPMLIPLAKDGLIKSIGVSNHNLAEIKRVQEILGAEGLRLSAVQNHYSLLHRSSERAGILRHCKENGITFYSYMVLEQGALTGKFDLDHPFPEGSSRAKTYNGMLTEIETLIAEMRHIGERHSASPAQIAIAWARSKGTLPIIGVTKVSQAEEAAKTAEIVLADEEISAVEELAERTGVSTLRGWEREM
ncbi:MAG: aldo/keto reductase [Oscillospiraceae bacterium]|nr:aldo/keto reductase [Oscillospiraceae bacterium]